ncbi:PHD finger protein MALE MEIOCYTE DEATH 1 [Vitis vinifera]|uniref:PHD finger protein MALE MEIOCYTE DEATH 1 n=1 Tax=Vitis vinifera TaxID=29760 RepID=A0A438GTE1_VITVI|nr:PHD finger protein MALE MEIOCYTE DEATH 1 [Vitis vinifera]
MSIPILEACKKRKRRPKLFGFHTFADPGCPINPTSHFCDNIRIFLRECAELEDYNVDGMPTWCTLLVNENRGFVVPVYTIEESVKYAAKPFCDHCRCTGWSNHFVSKRRYHIIIPIDDEWNKPLDDGVFDLQTHLLHGMIHCNGLVTCFASTGLKGVQGISAAERSWISGIEFAQSFEPAKLQWRILEEAIHGSSVATWSCIWASLVCSLELDQIIEDFGCTDRCMKIRQIFRFYRDLSETQLITLKDILRIMLTLKSRAPVQKKMNIVPDLPASSTLKPSTRRSLQNRPPLKDKTMKFKKFSTLITNMDSRWPARRLEYAADVIVNALREKRASECTHDGMTRQEVRDAARMHIGDTATRVLEYTLKELGKGTLVSELESEMLPKPFPEQSIVPGADVYNDVIYLYRNVLLNYPDSELVELATRAVLDSKHFVKEWPFSDEDDQLLRFVCHMMPSLSELEIFTRELPPGEFIVVPPYATVGELKETVERTLRDTYCIMEQVVVTEIEDMEGMTDEEVLFGTIESGSEVWMRGTGMDLEAELKYEGGSDNWRVSCECGALDDDGERMVACDICEVWQHTVCSGIDDSETVPPLFVCPKCCALLVPARKRVQDGSSMPAMRTNTSYRS